MNSEHFMIGEFPRQRSKLLNYIYSTDFDANINALSVLKDSNCFIAGGAITSVFTNNTISDYDVYFPMIDGYTNTSYDKISNELDKYICYCKDYETDFAQTFTGPGGIRIQLIKLYTDLSIYNMIHKFDFTVCMGAYSLKDKKFILDDRFLLNNSNKELVFNNNTDFPIASLIRTIKYQKKGYTINGIQMMMIAMAVQNLKIKTYEDFRKHIQGIDQTELLELTEQFRNNETSYDYKTMVGILQQYLNEHVYRGDAITD